MLDPSGTIFSMALSATTPVMRRPFRAFLSHAHADRQIVDRLYQWVDLAGFRLWYDAKELAASTKIAGSLAKAAEMCRASIIVVSESSIRSGWVDEELETSIFQRSLDKDFQVIPIRIDKCEMPSALRTTKWIDLPNGELSDSVALQLLYTLHNVNARRKPSESRDVYVSRSWRVAEAAFPDAFCRAVVQRGFRLIGDARDQQGFMGGERVRSIMESCGAAVAIVPHRGDGKTSDYILAELEIAAANKIPTLVLGQTGWTPPDRLPGNLIWWSLDDLDKENDKFEPSLDRLSEMWRPAARPHYAFLATDFDPQHAWRKSSAQELIERVTAMPCFIGDDIREGPLQKVIVDRIRAAFFMIADISEENLNTCIEAGVARGSNTLLYLIGHGPRRKPPFLFRDSQVHYYDNDAEMLANISRIIEPHRRRVLDDELCSAGN